MDRENLVEVLRGKCEVCKRESCRGNYWSLLRCPATLEAATALSTLQAENEKLREMYQKEKSVCHAVQAELEKVMRERDAAVKDLEDLMADTEDSVCWLCAKADSTEPCRGAKGTCTPKWRGIQTDSSP